MTKLPETEEPGRKGRAKRKQALEKRNSWNRIGRKAKGEGEDSLKRGNREADREISREMGRETGRRRGQPEKREQGGRQGDRQRDRQGDREADGKTAGEAGRERGERAVKMGEGGRPVKGEIKAYDSRADGREQGCGCPPCILVSACLLGEPCKYNGGSNRNGELLALIGRLEQGGRARFIPVCPEVMGGLATPRVPAEIQGERVMAKDGRDVTEEYRRGAELALKLAENHGCRLAVLKERSPSCGSGRIYDGTFSGSLVNGYGITARLLWENGVRVTGETEAAAVLKALENRRQEQQEDAGYASKWP